ncbi:uncharacterized protein LOC144648864 [Oculina patagonica]
MVIADAESSDLTTRDIALTIGTPVSGLVFLMIFIKMLRHCLIFCFPVGCGHRRCIFTGRSTKSLQEILLSVDNKIPTEEQLQEFKDNALPYLNDFKSALEKTMTTTFRFIFSGSAVERFGVPLMMPYKAIARPSFSIGSLNTDVDVMFYSLEDKASFSGQGNIFLEPRVTEGFIGYAKLTYVTPGVEGTCVSSKLYKRKAKDAVMNMPVINLPGRPWSCGMTELTPNIRLVSKGPTLKLRVAPFFEADITICIWCSEWPPKSDWPTRPRYWPKVDDVQRITSLGCHLVTKPAPKDQDKTSWRFSFSLAEVELSKLVPETARKCFLALKIILKDHLQPVASGITSYHLKTIFLNTLEKVPVAFWVDENIEECFLTLLTELRDALESMNCRHHWFSKINMFAKYTSCFCIETRTSQRLAKKVQTILNNPAPFIFDDGCCCLSPCCLRAPHNNVTRRTNEQFLAEYDEVMLSADGYVIAGTHNPIDPVSNRYQFSVSPSPRCEAQLDTSLYSSGNNSQEITTEPEQLVTSIPTMDNAEQEPSFCPGEAEDDSFNGSLPISVTSPLLGFQARRLQNYMAA